MVGGYYRKLKNMIRRFHETCDAVSRMERFVYYSEAARLLHPQIFGEYKNFYSGKNVALVACGPTVNYYEPMPDCVHIGVNRAFFNSKIKFSHLFMHDRQPIEENLELLKKYKAEKFVAFHMSEGNAKKYNAPFELSDEIGAKRFFVSDPGFKGVEENRLDLINPDISSGLIMDRGGGTVMSALQFILYTKPAKIFLVGCDCTDKGHFYNESVKNDLPEILPDLKVLWKQTACFIKAFYPDIEIISVNPVELKGLFKDEYTQKYLDAHAA